MTTDKGPALFDAYYFEHNCGTPYGQRKDWLAAYNRIADAILRDIQPKTMLDAGCAYGYMIEVMRQRGIECWGIDISEHAIQSVNPDVQPYCRVASVLDPLPQKYDLITCFEVVEHMPPGQGEQAIANLCQFSDDIVFCSSPIDYKEATHLNVQPVEYWAEQFAIQGFFRDVDFDGSAIVSWAARYLRIHEPYHRVARRYERRFWQLFKENKDARQALLDLRFELSNTTLVKSNLQNELVEMQSQLTAMQSQLIATQNQLAATQNQLTVITQKSLKVQILDCFHLLRLLIIPPASQRERWYFVLTRKQRS